MFKSFFLSLLIFIFLGNYFFKGSLMILLLFLEIMVLSVVFSILLFSESILTTFNLSIIFMIFGVIAATLGLTLLSIIFKSEDSVAIKSQLI